MKTLINTAIIAAFMFVVSVPFVAAQDEIHKGEFFAGYTFQRTSNDYLEFLADEGANLRNGNGFNVAGTYNFTRYLGAKGEFGWVRGSKSIEGFDLKMTETSFMGGIQVKDNKVEGSKMRPFAHVLMGMNRVTVPGVFGKGGPLDGGFGGGAPEDVSKTKFTMAIGGGIDYRVSDRMSIRAIQVDYKPTFTGDDFIETMTGLRFSFGIVIN